MQLLSIIFGISCLMISCRIDEEDDADWPEYLPAAGFATPVTYAIDGKQYIIIACGGTKLGTDKGDSYIAFSLP